MARVADKYLLVDPWKIIEAAICAGMGTVGIVKDADAMIDGLYQLLVLA